MGEFPIGLKARCSVMTIERLPYISGPLRETAPKALLLTADTRDKIRKNRIVNQRPLSTTPLNLMNGGFSIAAEVKDEVSTP